MPNPSSPARPPRVAFVLPATSRIPIGGFKVFYEYANALAADGYDVTVVHSFSGGDWPRPFSWHGACNTAKTLLRSAWHRFRGWHRTPPWFPLDPRVRFQVIWSLAERHLPVADIYLLSDARTVALAHRYRSIPPEHLIHFIQGHETWNLPPEALANLYRSPVRKIAISGWLAHEVEKAGGKAVIIPNAFDLDRFHMLVPPEERNPLCVGMLFHTMACKDVGTGFRALEMAKAREPGLRVRLFGAFPMDRTLPDWISYVRNPSPGELLEFYNGIALFLGTSRQEGWGLTVGEAMACGAAVVCTDNKGYAEMAIDGQTARVVPAGDAERMADALLELVHDDAERIRLAHAGHDRIQAFTWKRSTALLEAQLQEAWACRGFPPDGDSLPSGQGENAAGP